MGPMGASNYLQLLRYEFYVYKVLSGVYIGL